MEMVVQGNTAMEAIKKRKIKVNFLRSTWGRAAYLGPYADWNDRKELEVGLNLGPLIVGMRFAWGSWLFDPTETSKKPELELGTNLQNDFGNWHYARAGEDLKKGTLVEADLAGRIAPPSEPNTMEISSELIWGNVKAAKEVDRHGTNVLGWPEVKVRKGRYCWLRQPPLGSEFKKEQGKSE